MSWPRFDVSTETAVVLVIALVVFAAVVIAAVAKASRWRARVRTLSGQLDDQQRRAVAAAMAGEFEVDDLKGSVASDRLVEDIDVRALESAMLDAAVEADEATRVIDRAIAFLNTNGRMDVHLVNELKNQVRWVHADLGRLSNEVARTKLLIAAEREKLEDDDDEDDDEDDDDDDDSEVDSDGDDGDGDPPPAKKSRTPAAKPSRAAKPSPAKPSPAKPGPPLSPKSDPVKVIDKLAKALPPSSPIQKFLKNIRTVPKPVLVNIGAGTLANGSELRSGSAKNYIREGDCKVVMQPDGNLVLYGPGNKAIWSSNTYKKGKGPYRVKMQTDGNLVLYDSTNKALWHSKTYGKGRGPYRAKLQPDGNFVVYDSANKALWASGTYQKVAQLRADRARVQKAVEKKKDAMAKIRRMWR